MTLLVILACDGEPALELAPPPCSTTVEAVGWTDEAIALASERVWTLTPPSGDWPVVELELSLSEDEPVLVTGCDAERVIAPMTGNVLIGGIPVGECRAELENDELRCAVATIVHEDGPAAFDAALRSELEEAGYTWPEGAAWLDPLTLSIEGAPSSPAIRMLGSYFLPEDGPEETRFNILLKDWAGDAS